MSSRKRARSSLQAPVSHSDDNDDAYIGTPRVALVHSSSSSSSTSAPPLKKRKAGKEKVKKAKKVKVVNPYQNLTAKVRMVRINSNEDSLTILKKASGDETYMTTRASRETRADWNGPYPMWKDAKELVLFTINNTKVVMIMPGEDESHRIYDGKPVHTPNLLASAIVDEFFGPYFLGPDASNSIHGTVYIYEEFYNPDDEEYDSDNDVGDEGKEEPVTDLSDESIARLKKVWGMNEDDDDNDDEDDE